MELIGIAVILALLLILLLAFRAGRGADATPDPEHISNVAALSPDEAAAAYNIILAALPDAREAGRTTNEIWKDIRLLASLYVHANAGWGTPRKIRDKTKLRMKLAKAVQSQEPVVRANNVLPLSLQMESGQIDEGKVVDFIKRHADWI